MNIKEKMEQIILFIEQLNGTNSNNDKQLILQKYKSNDFITKVLVYTYSTFLQFNITSKNVEKYFLNKNFHSQNFNKYTSLFPLLDDLNSRKITGNKALKSVCEFVSLFPEEEKGIFYRILDKNLKIRINACTINKAYGRNIIDVFEPVLSKEYDPEFNILDKNWYISQKLDGTRCLIVIDENKNIKAFSRTGKEIYNLDDIIKNIPIDKLNNVVLDGELVHLVQGHENFKKTIEIVRSSRTIKNTENLYYKIFDMIPKDEFAQGKGDSIFIDRYNSICNIFKDNLKIKIVKQIQYTIKNFEKLNKQVIENNWEGLMVRRNVKYKGKRVRDLVKIKTFKDAEFQVIKSINGVIRIINQKSGIEENIQCMTSVVIDCDGIECNVGSGFSHQERKDYFLYPEKIVGKKITVKYFEKLESGSLRFPVFVCIRDYE